MEFQELNNDQRREVVNSQQRFRALRDAKEAYDAHRGSVTWVESKGHEYLARSYYDKAGLRKQSSLGARSPETEKMKADFEAKRAAAEDRLKNLRDTMGRQSAINRALGLGRVPLIGARIIRALDGFGMLGSGIRILEQTRSTLMKPLRASGSIRAWPRRKISTFCLMRGAGLPS